MSYNAKDKVTGRFQYEGVATISHNRIADKSASKGSDTRSWGRWVWTKYLGTDNSSFIVVTVYIPGKPNANYEGGVYAQPVRAQVVTGKDPQCP